MNNLLTLNNQFYFNLPVDFIPEELEEDYLDLLKAKRKLFKTVVDYINSTVQSITFPSINFPVSSNQLNFKRKKIQYKSTGNVMDYFDNTITVTFANVDSNINYLIMLDILMNHYLNNDKIFDGNINVTVLDENRMALFNIQFRDIIWTSLSDNQFSFNDQTITNKTFTATFQFNFIDLEFVKTKGNFITKAIN